MPFWNLCHVDVNVRKPNVLRDQNVYVVHMEFPVRICLCKECNNKCVEDYINEEEIELTSDEFDSHS